MLELISFTNRRRRRVGSLWPRPSVLPERCWWLDSGPCPLTPGQPFLLWELRWSSSSRRGQISHGHQTQCLRCQPRYKSIWKKIFRIASADIGPHWLPVDHSFKRSSHFDFFVLCQTVNERLRRTKKRSNKSRKQVIKMGRRQREKIRRRPIQTCGSFEMCVSYEKPSSSYCVM